MTAVVVAPPERRFLTVAEAARALGLSRAYTYTLVSAGEIPSVRFGRRVVIPARWIDQLAEKTAEAVAS